jgi:hypothetical protein
VICSVNARRQFLLAKLGSCERMVEGKLAKRKKQKKEEKKKRKRVVVDATTGVKLLFHD